MAYEQISTNLAKTTLMGSYTAGAGSLTVSSSVSGTVSGYGGSFPANPSFRVAILDQSTGAVKALLKVTAIPDNTHFTTAADAGGFDGNAVIGDIVAAPWVTAGGLTQALQDTSNYGADASAPSSATGARKGMRYLSSDAPYERVYDGSAWQKVPYGALVLLEQHTATNSATLDFTASITSAFDEYVVELLNLTPVTNAVDFNFRVSTDGGATYDTTASYYWGWSYVPNTGAAGSSQGNGQTALTIFTAIVNSASSGGVCGQVRLFSPLSTVYRKMFTFQVAANQANFYAGTGAGIWTPTTAVNAFRFLFSSGNISTGIIRCYGVSKGYTI